MIMTMTTVAPSDSKIGQIQQQRTLRIRAENFCDVVDTGWVDDASVPVLHMRSSGQKQKGLRVKIPCADFWFHWKRAAGPRARVKRSVHGEEMAEVFGNCAIKLDSAL